MLSKHGFPVLTGIQLFHGTGDPSRPDSSGPGWPDSHGGDIPSLTESAPWRRASLPLPEDHEILCSAQNNSAHSHNFRLFSRLSMWAVQSELLSAAWLSSQCTAELTRPGEKRWQSRLLEGQFFGHVELFQLG